MLVSYASVVTVRWSFHFIPLPSLIDFWCCIRFKTSLRTLFASLQTSEEVSETFCMNAITLLRHVELPQNFDKSYTGLIFTKRPRKKKRKKSTTTATATAATTPPNAMTAHTNSGTPSLPPSITKVFSWAEHRQAFSRCWLTFLQLKLPRTIYKEVLSMTHNKILPHLSNPLLLHDFLRDAYNVGMLLPDFLSFNSNHG